MVIQIKKAVSTKRVKNTSKLRVHIYYKCQNQITCIEKKTDHITHMRGSNSLQKTCFSTDIIIPAIWFRNKFKWNNYHITPIFFVKHYINLTEF